jgi:5-methylcytosine-specific restriction protein A
VSKWKLFKGDPGAIREAVNDRDQWICQICGADTFLLHRIVRRMRGDWIEMRGDWIGFLVMLGWSAHKAKIEVYWEVDHIIPLAEGGTHDLANLRCLCIPCHVICTKDLMVRLRSKKR